MRGFSADGFGIIGGHNRIEDHPLAILEHPFAEIQVETHAEFGVTGSIGGGGGGGRLANHEAGAGHNAALEGLDDAAVDSIAQTEIVGIDDKILRHAWKETNMRRSRSNSQPGLLHNIANHFFGGEILSSDFTGRAAVAVVVALDGIHGS